MSELQYKPESSALQSDWDHYWRRTRETHTRGFYERIAEFYRDQIISRSAARILRRELQDSENRLYLHAGCGSGGSDRRIVFQKARFHFLDISPIALDLHRRQPLNIRRSYLGGNLFALPYPAGAADAIFNFGVMEHFTEREIGFLLEEFHRVLKPGGRVILFWPPNFGLSVLALSAFIGVANRFRKTPLKFHPDEVSRIPSFPWARAVLARHRFQTIRMEFGWKDLFTYVAVIARRA